MDLPNTLRCQAKDIGCSYYIVDTGFDPYYGDKIAKHERTCPFVKLAPLLKAQNSRIAALEEKMERAAILLSKIDEDIAGRYIMMEMSICGVESTYILEIDSNLEGGRFRYDRVRSPQPLENFRVINGVLHFNMGGDDAAGCSPATPTRYSGEFSASTKGLITGSWTHKYGRGRWMALKI